jgi:hypothetical protein
LHSIGELGRRARQRPRKRRQYCDHLLAPRAVIPSRADGEGPRNRVGAFLLDCVINRFVRGPSLGLGMTNEYVKIFRAESRSHTSRL